MNDTQPVEIQPEKFYSNAARLSALHSFRGDYKPLIMQKLKYALLGAFRLEFSRGKKETLELLIRERERKVEKMRGWYTRDACKIFHRPRKFMLNKSPQRVFACTRLKSPFRISISDEKLYKDRMIISFNVTVHLITIFNFCFSIFDKQNFSFLSNFSLQHRKSPRKRGWKQTIRGHRFVSGFL